MDATIGSLGFRGFMIQGRAIADFSPVGTFAESGTDYQAVCENNVRLL